ncbi:cytochrome c oxidase assembly protein COX19-like isoform X2 [Asterias rubens]|nr:cytochrome c oxidase assembly protein COX19-like isoform X2 [Asterias rubens]XP_033629985.1 cytochrome c oxidase assembly protein COX19-like isoform X2 [Asterias rubens]
MSAMNFGQKSFKPRPPEKGSFPLDHDGECKKFKQLFMECLRTNKGDNKKCRLETKDYLQCRMESDLMVKEPWKKLGFADLESKKENNGQQ